MLTFYFTGADGRMDREETLTVGMVGKQIALELSADWEGLAKTVVFSAGEVTRDVVYTGQAVTIPAEVLEKPLETLYVGIYGVSADGTLAIPTIRVKGPQIQPGVEPSGDPGTDSELPVWAQIQAQIGPMEDLKTEQKGDLVAAINELSENCGTGEQGPAGADARIIAQAEPPEDTNVLWVDTGDDSNEEAAFANPLFGKSISFTGDSICAGFSNNGGYGKIIAQRNNMTYQNLGVSGSTITAEMYSDSSGKAYGWICRTIENMDDTADYAIVEGGLNDAWHDSPMGALTDDFDSSLDDTTYYGAFESMLKQLISRFPGKKIGYIAVHKRAPNFDSRKGNDYYTAAIACCRKWGVPVCDLNTTVPPLGYIDSLIPVYMNDGSHPTEEGYRRFYCDKIEAWLKTL